MDSGFVIRKTVVFAKVLQSVLDPVRAVIVFLA